MGLHMHREFKAISRALETRSPVVIEGRPVTISLIAIRESTPRGSSVCVVFGGTNRSDTHTVELQMGKERLQDVTYMVDRAVTMIDKVMRRGHSEPS